MPQIGPKSRVTCFWIAAVACIRLRVLTSVVKERTAMWCGSGNGVLLLTESPATARVDRVTGWVEQSQVAHYLLSLGLVNPRAVVEEDLVVTDMSRRNSVFVVTSSRCPTYVVKQAGPGNAGAVAHEAAILRALARVSGLAGHVPELVHTDAAGARLVMRSPAGAVAWNQLARVPRRPARPLGRVLATLHALPLDMTAQVDRSWGRTLYEPAYEQVQQMSAGALELLERLHSSQELCGQLRRLDEEASDDAFVHGDLRWDNCLAVGTNVHVIDWERAGRGDAAEDLGVAFGEYLRLWLGSIPIVDAADPGRLARYAGHPLERLQPTMRSLWTAYRRACPRPVALRRVAQMTAVRLLQTAMEYSQGLLAPTVELTTLAHAAEALLRAPDRMAGVLLGLSE
jgi:aminoglycoside phosphotransferase (APT) family kinase protein